MKRLEWFRVVHAADDSLFSAALSSVWQTVWSRGVVRRRIFKRVTVGMKKVTAVRTSEPWKCLPVLQKLDPNELYAIGSDVRQPVVCAK